jgi:hypothetical protein
MESVGFSVNSSFSAPLRNAVGTVTFSISPVLR